MKSNKWYGQLFRFTKGGQNNSLPNKTVVFLFITLISLPLGTFFVFSDQKKAEIEKRTLAIKPELQLNLQSIVAFPNKFEAYYNDHFGFRNTFIRWNNYLKVMCLKKSPVPKVVLGKNNWLFYSVADMLDNHRGIAPLSQLQLQAWKISIENKQETLAKLGIHYLFLVAPNKQSIYPEFLPDYLNRVSTRSQLDQLMAFLKNFPTIPILDIREKLMEAKTESPVYYSTDTHWNGKGAFIAYEAILNRINEWFPVIKKKPALHFQEHKQKIIGLGTANMLGLSEFYDDCSYTITNRNYCAQESVTPFPVHIELPNKNSLIIRGCKQQTLRALVFRDSFFTPIVPLLSEHFKEVVYVWSEYEQDTMKKIVKHFQPDIIIEEKAERWLFGNFTPVICHNIIGKSMLEKKMFMSAVKQFSLAASLQPDHPEIQNTLGYALLQAHRFDEAIAQFQKVLQLAPDHKTARKNLQLCKTHIAKSTMAINKILTDIKFNPKNIDLHHKLGLLYKKIGRTDSALQSFQNMLAIEPTSIKAIENIALIYHTTQEYDKAIYYLKKVISLEPDRKDAYYNLACLYAKSNHLKESISWLQLAVKKGYNNWDLIRSDQDLDNIRKSTHYRSFLTANSRM